MPLPHPLGEGSCLLSTTRAIWADLHILDQLARRLSKWVDDLKFISAEMQNGNLNNGLPFCYISSEELGLACHPAVRPICLARKSVKQEIKNTSISIFKNICHQD